MGIACGARGSQGLLDRPRGLVVVCRGVTRPARGNLGLWATGRELVAFGMSRDVGWESGSWSDSDNFDHHPGLGPQQTARTVDYGGGGRPRHSVDGVVDRD